jgi:uncharacterized protein (DUF1778 family)
VPSIFANATPEQKKLIKAVAAMRGMTAQDLVNALVMEEARRVLTTDQLNAILKNGAAPPEVDVSPKSKAAQR